MVLCRWWCVDVQMGMMIEQEPLKLPITVLNRRRTSADLSAGAPRAKPATQNETEVLRVQHLPRKMRLRCSKCCACHAKWGWGAPSAEPATQTQPASTVLNPRRTSADLSGGARRAALAAQWNWGAPSAAPRHAKWDWGAPSALQT